MLGLIYVQTVCKAYQQTTLASRGLSKNQRNDQDCLLNAGARLRANPEKNTFGGEEGKQYIFSMGGWC